jgi:hypothetical protein
LPLDNDTILGKNVGELRDICGMLDASDLNGPGVFVNRDVERHEFIACSIKAFEISDSPVVVPSREDMLQFLYDVELVLSGIEREGEDSEEL